MQSLGRADTVCLDAWAPRNVREARLSRTQFKSGQERWRGSAAVRSGGVALPDWCALLDLTGQPLNGSIQKAMAVP